MFNGKTIKIFIFAGRQATMEILLPQFTSPIIDQIILAKNTFNETDLKYIDSIAKQDRRICTIDIPDNIKKDRHCAWKYLYRFMQDSDSLYFKIDDDVVYIEPGYFEKTAKFKMEHPEYLCIFPMTINNPFCNLLPQHSPIRNLPLSRYWKMRTGFYYGEVGQLIHQAFLANPTSGEWKVGDRKVTATDVEWESSSHPHMVSNMVNWYYAERIAINAICYDGNDFNQLDVANRIQACYSDELFLTYNIFDYTKKTHCVYGDTLVAHFAFSGQKGLRDNQYILNQYKSLSQKMYGIKGE